MEFASLLPAPLLFSLQTPSGVDSDKVSARGVASSFWLLFYGTNREVAKVSNASGLAFTALRTWSILTSSNCE